MGSFVANPFGLHDTAGNVWEWVQDCWHENYEGGPIDGSAWEPEPPEDCLRVLRGGSWEFRPRYVRSAARYWTLRNTGGSSVGFRLAQDQ